MEVSYAGLREHDVFGTLVVAQAEINGLAQFSIGGQFLVGDLRDKVWLKKCDVMLAGRLHERCLAAHEWLKLFVECGQSLLVEASSHFPDVVKLALFIG